jgi:hypothetical protein
MQATTAPAAMTKGEREDLQRLIRQCEKVLKSAAKQRSAELLGDFENQWGSEYSFDDDATWAQAIKAVEREVAKAQALIAARCRELGIPSHFAPTISMHWHHRGYDNLLDDRKKQLRTVAETPIAAIEQKAIVEIELSCLEAQTQIAVSGLASDQARQFIEKLPSIETLMPRLAFAELAGEADPPIAEQLVSPNTLRQRRHRERQWALRNGPEALHNADVTPVPVPAGDALPAPDPAPAPAQPSAPAGDDPWHIPSDCRRVRAKAEGDS